MKINPAPSCRGIAPRRKAILSHSSPQQAAGYSGRCWIKPETLEKLRVILKNEFGQEVNDQDLHDIAFNLVGFYDALMRFYCEECKGRITWEIQRGHWYGHCNHYKNCQQREFVRQEVLDAQLIETINTLNPKGEQAVESMLSWVQEALKESHSEEIEFRDKSTAELNRRYEVATQRLDKIYDDKIDEKISEEFYKKKYEQYKVEQEQILDSLNKHKDANLKYYEMGETVLQVAKKAWKIYINRDKQEMVDDKKLLLSLIFSNTTLNGKKVEISYQKAFKMVSNRVMQMLGEKVDEKNTFEPPKEPVNKGKTPAFADVHPIWLRGWDSNPRPIDYIYPKVTSRDGLYHHPNWDARSFVPI